MATSKALGTGRNAATMATSRIPATVTFARSAWGGRSSTTNAPRSAARSMSGRAARATYQKLFAKDLATPVTACGQGSETGNSIGQGRCGSEIFSREMAEGTNTKIRKRTVPSLRRATETGNKAKVMARTTTLRAGEANMVART